MIWFFCLSFSFVFALLPFNRISSKKGLVLFFDFLTGYLPIFAAQKYFAASEHVPEYEAYLFLMGISGIAAHHIKKLTQYAKTKVTNPNWFSGFYLAVGVVFGQNPFLGLIGILFLLPLSFVRRGHLFLVLLLCAALGYGCYFFLLSDFEMILIGILFLLGFLPFFAKFVNRNTAVIACVILGAGVFCKNAFCLEAQKKIVALMPNLAEAVIDFGKSESLLAAPEYTNLKSLKIKNLGPYNRISAESVVTLKPDLVFANADGNDKGLIESLQRVGVEVVVFDTSSIKSIISSYKKMASILETKPTKGILDLMKTLETLEKSNYKSGKSVFIQIGWDPIVSVNSKTFVGEIFEKTGFKNIFGDSLLKYPKINPEEVLSKNPDLILICKLTDSDLEVEKALKFWKQFQRLKAITQNQIHVISGDILVKPGPGLVAGIEKIRSL